MIASLSIQQTSQCFSRLRERVDSLTREVFYLNLGGVKTIRVICGHPNAKIMIHRQLEWSLVEPVQNPDASLVFWEEPQMDDFFQQTFGLSYDHEQEEDYLMLIQRDGDQLIPFAESNQGKDFRSWLDNQYYYAVQSMEPEILLKEGHLFVHLLYRILDSPSTQLIHGACVGVDGKGVLLCSRGGGGNHPAWPDSHAGLSEESGGNRPDLAASGRW